MTKTALAGAVVLVLTVSLLAAGVALAHSRPVRLDPPPGAVLQSAPAQVQGWFTADIRRDSNWSFIHVSDAQGNRVDSGDTQLSTDRRQMTAVLKSGLGPGRYIVTWRTYDEGDGAIFGDCYTFFVGQAAADQAISDKFRLDAGGACERINFSAREGTPAPGQTPAASGPDEGAEAATSTSGGSGSDIPIWGLALGIASGLVVGLVAGRTLLRS